MDMPADAEIVFAQYGVVMGAIFDAPGTFVYADQSVDLSSDHWLEQFPLEQREDWIAVDTNGGVVLPESIDLPVPPDDPFIAVIIDMGILVVGDDLLLA